MHVVARRYPDRVTDTLTPTQARRIALAAQGFTRARPASVAGRHVHRVMDRLGVLQIDSVNVFARSHYLPLFSRLGSYEPALLDRVFLSRTTHYVEYLAHEATFIPIEDWPLWRFRMDDFRRRWAGEESWMSSNARTLQWVQDELRVRGPLRPADLRADAPRERGTWWDWDDVKLALEHLWRTGDVAISGRRGFERTYALAEHVIPDAIRSQEVSRADAIRELTRRAARSSGVATQSDLADYYRIRDRAAVALADLIGDDRAEIASNRTRRRGEIEVEPAGRDEIARKRHDDLGRERDARAFDRHQDRDTGIAARGNHPDGEGGQGRQDLLEHGRKRLSDRWAAVKADLQGIAAVTDERGAGDERGGVGKQEGDLHRDFLWLGIAAERRRHLSELGERGFAPDLARAIGDPLPGVNAFAAPVFDHAGHVVQGQHQALEGGPAVGQVAGVPGRAAKGGLRLGCNPLK